MGDQATQASQSDVQLPDEALDDLEWVTMDTLLNANRRTNQILEQYLLQQYHLDNGPDVAALERQISETIAEHERIIEDLETARTALNQAPSID
ncbi:hypothetical protein [Halocalculus aciditolerans]|uniref:DUF8103 domain-containing protein n=1 Tax=Halocalculus aciditolerans TaxID=1383812 RepID=A0A830F229_9EURY|nr:hypothetical protein [Halocalculus aciditolerans]GGL47686.1 hypothetical protein GCM10009039_02420 [Halocalculus aciditolerans]